MPNSEVPFINLAILPSNASNIAANKIKVTARLKFPSIENLIELIQNEAISESNRQNYLDFIKFNAETLYEDGLARPQMLAGPDWRNQATGTIDFATQLSGVMLIEAAAKLEAQDLL